MSKIFMCLFLAFSIYNPLVFGQKTETILSAPSDWNSEIFHFPLEFAPKIDFDGFEEIRFAPRWADSTSKEFWTYHFTWFIEKKYEITEDFLSETFNLYYDGLAKTVLEEQSDSIRMDELDKTISLFITTDEGFSGKTRVFDSFFTKDYIILNVKVREKTCKASNKQIISFDISPQSFSDEIWDMFNQIEVIKKCR